MRRVFVALALLAFVAMPAFAKNVAKEPPGGAYNEGQHAG